MRGAAFDDARRHAGAVARPWHQAVVTEVSARFHLEHGLQESGEDLLIECRAQYAAWSAHGKLRQLDAEFPVLAAGPRRRPSTSGMLSSGHGSADDVDMMAVLRSSQALGSETGLTGLRARVGEVLGAITGAMDVFLVLRAEASPEWQVWDTDGASADGVPLADAGHLVPISAVRYAERTGTPLMIHDGATDDRFTGDPFLAGLVRSSALLVPLAGHRATRGVLVLENRRRVGAFADQGLEAVLMITGQLVASLDNAQLYASLERKVAERTRALEEANTGWRCSASPMR